MPASRHLIDAESHSQHHQPAVDLGHKLKSGYSTSQAPAGLDITYEGHQESSYHVDQSERAMGWDKRDMPVPRHVGNKPFTAAYDPETDTSTRIDSLFDAYADMYADEGDAEQDEDGAVADYYGSSIHKGDEEEQEEDYASQPQAREPWDQRGKNGLYGGGGRGADDQETGWVSNYGLGGGREEDLRYDGAEEHTRRTERMDSADTQRDDRRRSSSDTEHSSYGPVTPTNNSFSGPSGGAHIAQPDSGYRSHNSPASTKTKDSSRTAYAKAPPMPQVAPIVVPSPPISTTLKKKVSAPVKASGMPTAIVEPIQRVDPSLLHQHQQKKKSSSAFKWTGRSKKPPTISNPILPEGFVESLGMETFALTPGCAAPNHLHQTVTPAPRVPVSGGNSDHGSSAGSIKSGGRKDAPRPRKIPQRPNYIPPLKLGEPVDLTHPIKHPDGTTSLPRSESPLATPVRLPLAALRNSSGDERDSSHYSHEVNDAFRRLSRDSEVSYAPSSNTIASAEKTRRLFFNGIREDMARQHDTEVQANRAPALTNAPAIPAIPSRYADEVESPLQHTPTAPGTRHDSTDSGFRNPWGPSTGARSSGGSFNTYVHRGSKGSLPKGWTGEARGSTTSGLTVHQAQSPYSPHPFSAPLVESSPSQDSYASKDPQLREARQGSTSSAYSEYSTATTADLPGGLSQDFPTTPSPPANQPLYASFPMAGQQPHRRGSLVPPSQAHGGTPIPIPSTAPLKLRRQQNEERVLPSAQQATSPPGQTGFNNWGHEEGGKGYSFPPHKQQEAKEIGSTGFRNPFG